MRCRGGDPFWDDTIISLNFTNGYYDEAAKVNMSVSGSPTIMYDETIDVNTYTTTSTNSFISRATTQNERWGSSNFTVECYAKFYSFAGWCHLMSFGGDPSGYTALAMYNNKQIWHLTPNIRDMGDYITPALSTDTWYHIAACRDGSLVRIFIDGSEVWNKTIASGYSIPNHGTFRLTRTFSSSGGNGINASIAGARVTKAARYTEGFTPPSLPYPTAST